MARCLNIRHFGVSKEIPIMLSYSLQLRWRKLLVTTPPVAVSKLKSHAGSSRTQRDDDKMLPAIAVVFVAFFFFGLFELK